ncbi:glycosyl transferase [Spirochaetia bacterium]|nr:glycosyl transferase [Spirochaetia bacterium]
MNITIDCRMLGSSGVGVYLSGCIPYLLESSNDFILLGESEKLSALAVQYKNTIVLDCTIKPFSLTELLFFPPHILKIINQSDIFYSPYFNIPRGISIPVFTTIHDIIFPDIRELTSKAGLAVRMYFYRRAAKKSKKIFTVSGFSKSRIEHHLGDKTPIINASNAVVIPEDYFFKPLKKEKKILFIGNIKKHKGLGTLLDAFLDAKKEGLDYKLIIVGSKDNFRTSDTDMKSKLKNVDPDMINFTGFIPELEKEKLLMESALLVQPSLYEGFGYPPLEAMLRGTSALISDIPVFREVYGDFPVKWFKAGDVKDLKDTLISLLYKKKSPSCTLTEEQKNMYSFKKTAVSILRELPREYNG